MVIPKKNTHVAVSYTWTDQWHLLGPPVERHVERRVKPNTRLSDTQPDSWKWTSTQPDSWEWTSHLLICFLSACPSCRRPVSILTTHLPFTCQSHKHTFCITQKGTEPRTLLLWVQNCKTLFLFNFLFIYSFVYFLFFLLGSLKPSQQTHCFGCRWWEDDSIDSIP